MAISRPSLDRFQVFLNYPFDREYQQSAYAMHFAIVAAGLIPVCALDTTVPDYLRLQTLTETISSCAFSAHDLSRIRGEGQQNLGRHNMPLEMGMALFHAMHTQWSQHRCAFLVATPHDHKRAISDLGGLDPLCYENNDHQLLVLLYGWLKEVGGKIINTISSADLKEKYEDFNAKLTRINGGGIEGRPTHRDARELMFQICAESGWWDWRNAKFGEEVFPEHLLSWKDH